MSATEKRLAITQHPPSRCADPKLARNLDRDECRYFECPRCKEQVCGACEGTTESQLCDVCWCAAEAKKNARAGLRPLQEGIR